MQPSLSMQANHLSDRKVVQGSSHDSAAVEECTVTREDLERLLPLVHQIASQLMRRLPPSVQREDLVAAGTVGLLLALRSGRRPPEVDGRSAAESDEMFHAYARMRIRGAMLDELRRGDWSPRRKKGAERAPVAVVRFDDLPPHVSFASGDDTPFDAFERRAELRAVVGAMSILPAREREILELRYFDAVPAKTIAQSMGLSEARVSQLHARATRRLYTALRTQRAGAKLAA